MIRRTCVTLTVLFAVACGSSNDTPIKSGLPEDAEVTSLSEADMNTLCNWVADYEGGTGTSLECNYTVNDPSTCVAGILAAKSCQLTVSQVETCAYAFKSDACTALGNPACGALQLCSM
jgi:hypothetical protein